MKSFVAAAVLAASTFAQDWSGYLVDAKCYSARERNVNPTDTQTTVDRNLSADIRYCRPTPRTKAFVFIQQNGLSFRLDDAGDAKAEGLVRSRGKRAAGLVTIAGQKTEHTLHVDSISLR